MAYNGSHSLVDPGSISSPPEMIAAIRAAILKPQGYCSDLKAAFFHSTPILQRKHQSNSKARSKRFGRKRAKQDFRRNVNAFANHLFGIWSDGFDYSGKHTSWFEEEEEEEEEDSSTEFSNSDSNQESHRQTLGLSSSGPLNLEDVKIAYRASALEWHPDRHHGATKNAAEEKFKLCTVAYQSLCEKLAMN